MAKSARGLPWSYPGATLELPWSYPGATLWRRRNRRRRGLRGRGDDEAGCVGSRAARRPGPPATAQASWASWASYPAGCPGRVQGNPAKTARAENDQVRKKCAEPKLVCMGNSRLFFFPHTKSFFGKYVWDAEPPQPGFGPDLGRRVHEEAENASKASNCGAQASASLNCSISDCSLLRVLPYEHNS